MWLQLLTSKDKAAAAIKKFKMRVEDESGKKLCVLRTDRGGEFTSMEFVAYCANQGVVRQHTAPYSPQQNGVVERWNQTVVGMPRSMVKAKGVVPSTPTEQGTPSTLIEFASPPSDITEFVDAFHDGEEVRFRRLEDIVSGTGPLDLAGRLLNDPELLLVSAEEPPMFALAECDGNWRRAMLEEMKAIEENKTWELINPPPECRPIGLKWVYKVKRDGLDAIVKHKACLIAQGFV
ncbi:uncharacterized protein [Miscanthus floridulus]|uniref:uncharacterized protein n=1 Tax=Miscanthus floridulus TaxID=154761 RepID=UPI0034574E16